MALMLVVVRWRDGSRTEEGMGVGFHYLAHRKDRKVFCWFGFAFFALQYFSEIQYH
jgi:hypothetical protein